MRVEIESKYGVGQNKTSHYSRLEGSWGILQRRQFFPEQIER